jgi:hypothetical protein
MIKSISKSIRLDKILWNNITNKACNISWLKNIFSGPEVTIKEEDKPWLQLSHLLNAYNGTDEGPEILYFGDSVLLRVAHEDQDRKTLGEMVSANLSSAYKTCCICHSAYTPRIFSYFGRVLELTSHRPRLVILPINMRCFSPQWDLEPQWQFEWEIGIINSFRANPHTEIPVKRPNFSPDSGQEDFNNLKVRFAGTTLDRIRQFRAVIAAKPSSEDGKTERWKTIFIYHYMYKLEPEHRTLLKIIELANCLLLQGIGLLIYITPVNYEAGKRYLGQLFDQTLAANVALIKNQLAGIGGSSGNILVADWSRMLGSKEFFHESDPTEHLNEQGRKHLAGAIVTAVHNLMIVGPTGA